MSSSTASVSANRSLVQTFRGLLRQDVLSICLLIFMADFVAGMLSSTFSLYAKELGATFATIGALSGIVGVTQLFVSVPIGMESDRRGRKAVLVMGMLSMGLSTALFAAAQNVWWLFAGRMLLGIAFFSTFQIGVAALGDVVTPQERGVAYGMFTSIMGIAFAIGPLAATAIAGWSSMAVAYTFAAAVSFAGALAGWRTLPGRAARTTGAPVRPAVPPLDALRTMLANPHLVAGSIANLLMSTVFGGAMSNFFPVYVAQLSVPQSSINTMFSARAFGSTLARFPSGAATSRIPPRRMILAALLVALSAVLLMSLSADPLVLGALLVLEGVAFGMHLPSGQAFVAEQSTAHTRGQVVGGYGMAGSLGNALAPLVLGIVAEVGGVQAVFPFTVALIVCGLAVIFALFRRPVSGSQ